MNWNTSTTPPENYEVLCIDSYGSWRLGHYSPKYGWTDYEDEFICKAWCELPEKPEFVEGTPI